MLPGQQLAFFPAGLLRLEELIRRFLISRETLSIRMLDDNLDPTPLLKEIRDDKIATIIIDANASISYLILKKVSVQLHYLNDVALAHFTFIHSLVFAHLNRSPCNSALFNIPAF